MYVLKSFQGKPEVELLLKVWTRFLPRQVCNSSGNSGPRLSPQSTCIELELFSEASKAHYS